MPDPNDPPVAPADPVDPARARSRAIDETLAEPPGASEESGAIFDPAEVMRSVTRPGPVEAGAQIGPYRLLETLGEGGMGVVYKAEQKQPVRRLVALKVIKLGMDTREVVARFEAERQALALMSHPNVAKVFEAGITPEGRPYFAMEFVAGMPLTKYCDESRLTTRERLELFVQVCQAIQHAHQKGIIHRDLKPTNILVTHFDGKPVPKVIDFGIAKAANQALTDRTLYTRTGSIIGTPEYMSPEQALTSGLDVDTRSDVYSLGVILYELLTGALPFDARSLHAGGLEEMARIIKETTPHKPSTRLSLLDADANVDAGANPAAGAGAGANANESLAAALAIPKPGSSGGGAAAGSGSGTGTGSRLSDVAQRRRSDPRALRREIRGDLDWIILKAMDKDRTRRYETANALAMDVRRHLDSEPVLARPPSVAYRLTKFVHKHKVGVAAAVAVVVALAAGLGAATYGLVRARHDRDAAVAARAAADEHRLAAERAREQAMLANRFLGDIFMSFGSGSRNGDTPQIKEAIRRLDAGWLGDQPDVHAAVRIALGYFYMSNGFPEPADAQFDIAARVASGTGGEPPEPAAMGAIAYGRGVAAAQRKDYASCEANFRAALAAYRQVPDAHAMVAELLGELAELRTSERDAAGARRYRVEQVAVHIAVQDERIAANPNDASALSVRGRLRAQIGQFKEAAADLARANALAPNDGYSWYVRGVIQLYLGDNAAHR